MSDKENLKIGLLQAELKWEDKKSNLDMVKSQIGELRHKPDLIVLPEMFSSGFTMNPAKVAEDNDGETIKELCKISKGREIAICGSFVAGKENYFNRFFWIEQGELKDTYDKRHLFRMAEENDVYTAGKGDARISFKGWKIMPRVCYDLRFPVWCRSKDVDLQIYVANWPKPRVAAWDKLLMARAIENQCYVIGVNRVGTDGNEVEYSGHSIAIDPKGESLTEIGNENEGWIIANLNLKMLEDFRKKFPVGLDADEFTVHD